MSIVTLMHEMNKHGKRVFNDDKWIDRKLVLFATKGCHQTFEEQINRNRNAFHDIIQVVYDEPDRDISFLEHFKVGVTKANHYDQTDHDSVGYIIKSKTKPEDPKNNKALIGFTGDTRWYYGIEDNYQKCPVICLNIGGVVDIFKDDGDIMLSDLCSDDCNSNIKKVLLRENHLYLPGFYLMAKKLDKKNHKLLILSELCEEMKGGLRTDLSGRLYDDLEIPVIPEDIGLTVILDGRKQGYIVCKACNSPQSPKRPKHKNIVPVETDKDNAIIYLCRKHYNQLKEGYVLPKINELEFDIHEKRKPLNT